MVSVLERHWMVLDKLTLPALLDKMIGHIADGTASTRVGHLTRGIFLSRFVQETATGPASVDTLLDQITKHLSDTNQTRVQITHAKVAATDAVTFSAQHHRWSDADRWLALSAVGVAFSAWLPDGRR